MTDEIAAEKPKKAISLESQRLWYGAMLERYNAVNNGITSIDTKTSVILAATVTILLFVMQNMHSMRDISQVLATGVCVQVVAITAAITGIKVGDQHTQVNMPSEQKSYNEMADKEFTDQLILDLEYSILSLEKINSKKSTWFYRSLWAFLSSTLLVLMSRVIELTIVVKLL